MNDDTQVPRGISTVPVKEKVLGVPVFAESPAHIYESTRYRYTVQLKARSVNLLSGEPGTRNNERAP